MTRAREAIRLTEAGDAGPQNDLIPRPSIANLLRIRPVSPSTFQLVRANMIAYAALL